MVLRQKGKQKGVLDTIGDNNNEGKKIKKEYDEGNVPLSL